MDFSLIVGAVLSLTSALIGICIGGFWDRANQSRKIILEQKIIAYSSILQLISESFMNDHVDLANDPYAEHRMRSKLITTLSRGRLFADKELEVALRDLYDLYSTFLKTGKFERDLNDVPLELRVEQLMRKEIGSKKLY